ncbi:MAG TPA: hypothetical protein VHV77_08265, partial [Pirellulales bacterium]|nr:hypothetical protein [Pirellulales bacterium]
MFAVTMSVQESVPLGVALAVTVFVVVLVPLYHRTYGPTNFLYFCDVALLLTLVGVWTDSRLIISTAAVGILIPQTVWLLDFTMGLCGLRVFHLTDYMFRPSLSLMLRALSLYHGWLPLLLIWLVLRIGYDPRAFWVWTVLSWG